MIRMIVAGIVALALTLVFFSAYASDQNAAASQALRAEARSACMDDYRKFCAMERPGQGRLYQCLKARESELSEACRAIVAESRPPRAQ